MRALFNYFTLCVVLPILGAAAPKACERMEPQNYVFGSGSFKMEASYGMVTVYTTKQVFVRNTSGRWRKYGVGVLGHLVHLNDKFALFSNKHGTLMQLQLDNGATEILKVPVSGEELKSFDGYDDHMFCSLGPFAGAKKIYKRNKDSKRFIETITLSEKISQVRVARPTDGSKVPVVYAIIKDSKKQEGVYCTRNLGANSKKIMFDKSVELTQLHAVNGAAFVVGKAGFVVRSTDYFESHKRLSKSDGTLPPEMSGIKKMSGTEEFLIIVDKDKKSFASFDLGDSWVSLASIKHPSVFMLSALEYDGGKVIALADVDNLGANKVFLSNCRDATTTTPLPITETGGLDVTTEGSHAFGPTMSYATVAFCTILMYLISL